MIADIGTMVWKEWKEIFMRRTGRSGLMSIGVILLLLGVILPLQTGKQWLTSQGTTLAWAWLPVFLALSLVTDAFAGERERHTLETLLASRLSDRAILFGKIAAAVLYGWGMSLVGLLLGAVTVNIAHPSGGFVFYPAGNFLVTLALSLLATLFISTLGVMVSLTSPTARAAYQKLSMVMLVLFLLPTVLVQVLPANILDRVLVFFNGLDVQRVLMYVIAGLLVLDAFLVVLVAARFQRSRLMESME